MILRGSITGRGTKVLQTLCNLPSIASGDVVQLPSWYFVCFLFLATKPTQEIPTLALEVLYLYNVFSSLKGCSTGSLGSSQVPHQCLRKTIKQMGVSPMVCREVLPEAHARNARIISRIICGLCGLWLKKCSPFIDPSQLVVLFESGGYGFETIAPQRVPANVVQCAAAMQPLMHQNVESQPCITPCTLFCGCGLSIQF